MVKDVMDPLRQLRGGILASLALTLSATPALADDASDARGSCEPTAAPSPLADAPDRLDPRLRGVALSDLDLPEGRMVSDYLRAKGVLPLAEVLSTSIVELRGDRVVVDVVGRAARFDDTDTQKHAKGRVGLVRVAVHV